MAGPFAAEEFPDEGVEEVTSGPFLAEEVEPAPSGPSSAVTYRMKGFDTNGSVNAWVYWTANTIDATASEYSGSAGPVINIGVVKEIGA